MNGISEKTDATGAIAWWILALQLAMGISFVLFIVFLVMFILKYRKEQKTMNQRKFSRLEFVMGVLSLLLNIVGLVLFFVSYTTGYYKFGEMNSPMILSFFLVGIGMEIFSLLAMVKWGDKMWTRFLTFAITALLVAGAILLIGDRVEGIGNCIVTDYDSRSRR